MLKKNSVFSLLMSCAIHANAQVNQNFTNLRPDIANKANTENTMSDSNQTIKNKAISANDLLEQQIYQRFNDKQWHKKLVALNERALWQEYIYLQNMQNYLSNLQGKKKEHIEAMLANYTSLKLRQNQANKQTNSPKK